MLQQSQLVYQSINANSSQRMHPYQCSHRSRYPEIVIPGGIEPGEEYTKRATMTTAKTANGRTQEVLDRSELAELLNARDVPPEPCLSAMDRRLRISLRSMDCALKSVSAKQVNELKAGDRQI